MQDTATILTVGHIRTLVLPASCRIDTEEAWISQDEVTGEIHIKPKPGPADEIARHREIETILQDMTAELQAEAEQAAGQSGDDAS